MTLSRYRHATLARSWRLLRSFRFEQTAPQRFYGPLAEDTAVMVEALYGGSLSGARVLDVGGGPGYFRDAFLSRGATYVSLEPEASDVSGDLAAGVRGCDVRGSGMALPFRDNSFDVVLSSNVAEHIALPWLLGDEMVRITAGGGLTVLSYTVWLGPFGGHETGLWQHYVGGAFARERYRRVHGRDPKNVFGTSLFALSCADGLRWAQRVAASGAAEIVELFPRYHPRWAWWLVRVPVIREFFVSNLVIALRKKPITFHSN